MTDFDIDLLLIKLIKQKSSITIFDLVSVVKESIALLSEKIVEQLREVDILEKIESLDDDIPVGEVKRVLAGNRESFYGTYLRASTIMMANSIKEQFVDADNISQEEAKYINEMFDSLLEMQRLYNFIRHFSRTLKVPNLKEEINHSVAQEKVRKLMEEKTSKKLAILDEIEEAQLKIISLKTERNKLINKITGKSKEIDFTIKTLEEKVELLKNQLREMV